MRLDDFALYPPSLIPNRIKNHSLFIVKRCSKLATRLMVPGFLPRRLPQLTTSSPSCPLSIYYFRKLRCRLFTPLNFVSYLSADMSGGKEDRRDTHFEYNWIDGVETLEKYRPGGYHPIMIGDMLHGRYRIVDKLGFGGYSTVWLARDTSLNHYVAVKVGIADSKPHETSILRALAAPQPSSLSTYPGHNAIPFPLDEFKLNGPNGTHPCYTTTPARCNLKEVSFSRLFPLEVARALSGGLTLAIAYIHSRGYIHGGLS